MLIAGPTASGKSALALEKARALDGVVVNADSMQVYDSLSIVTARPQPDELAQAMHKLYGFVPAATRFSTGGWLAAVSEVIADPALGDRPLIFTGGTGLYFDALINGVAVVPPVPQAVVERVEHEVGALDREGRRALLAARDPAMVNRLPEPDRQRLVRALAVLEATGKSLAAWQDETQAGLLDGFEVERLVLNPDRDVLRERIARRFAAMVDQGAVEEVAGLMAQNLDARLPVMKAIGVREIAAWQAGEMSREAAIERAIIGTHQYAKRQRTWFRNRMGDWDWIE